MGWFVLGLVVGILVWAAVVEHRHWADAREGRPCAVAEHYKEFWENRGR